MNCAINTSTGYVLGDDIQEGHGWVKQIPYMTVYNTPPVIIFWVSEFLSPDVVYCGGVVYTVPPVIKWVVVWDCRLFTTPGGILQGCDTQGCGMGG